MIRTVGLSKIYGQQKSVDNLNMTVRQGEIYAFLGRNGAGKTTTIRMLLGLIRPTAGQVELFGEPLTVRHKQNLSRIGSMVEIPGFYENLTARENLLINTRIMGTVRKNAIDEALELLDLHQQTRKLVGNYSLGMKQRLGIARALLHDPELLILDEPTNGLDPIGIREMRRLIRQLAHERKITILISSHILSEIEQLADRIGIIHEGRLLEEMDTAQIRSLSRRYLEFQVSDDNKAALLLEQHCGIMDYEVHPQGIIRIYSALDQQAQLNRLFVEQELDVYKLVMKEERLEDYFTKLVGGGTIG
ncbi:ABC transporter ATP-binding protein [Paenibacillus donghaensis]|uniref:Bacitracin ABC transporter ATP-binding protein n=1 Tax=Paenibacillus donghaensis TaxID=414771 RepID=A0A2Z2KQT2_9BACL|nr:ABC transporter ATP-binding protein [Paenibacillus donghaensis]ASA26223.1 bacitracin ABC transporter ATP-binding protein [Paenibacillus donghaensis]